MLFKKMLFKIDAFTKQHFFLAYDYLFFIRIGLFFIKFSPHIPSKIGEKTLKN